MYFKDLTKFSYMLERPCVYILNVGWLEQEASYDLETPLEERLQKLKDIVVGNENVDVHMNRIRGVLPCRICKEHRVEVKNSEGCSCVLGMSEILIPSTKKGEYYASPSMIVHYIEHHSYKVPEVFWQAVEQFYLSSSFNAQDAYDRLVELS